MPSCRQLASVPKNGIRLLAIDRMQMQRKWYAMQRHMFVQYRYFAGKDVPLRGVVVGVYEGEGDKDAKLTVSGEKVDDKSSGKLMELIKETHIRGHLGKGKLFNNFSDEFFCVAAVGLGKMGAGYNDYENIDEGLENVRVAAGVGARACQLQGCTEVAVDGMEYPEQAAEGAALAVWRYNSNRRKKDRTQIPKLELFDSPDMDAWTRGLFKAEAQNLARRLTDSPGNQMTPTIFAQAAVDALCPCGVTVEVRTMDWIEAQQLNSFLMIAKGSCEPPMVLEISYCGSSPDDRGVLLVGKGMTFNSGGLCLRKKRGMEEFRGAMSGAAVCVGAIRAAAALSLPMNVSAVIPLCENMPSGMACKPGDVVTLLNGMTLGVRDLKMAGVAVLADPLLYAQTTFKPKVVIDIATLGEGVRSGLGGGATGVWTNSNFVFKQLRKAGTISGDRMWRMPLWKYYKQLVRKQATYDLGVNGIGPASSCLAAAILSHLVPCADWAHLDTRGTGMLTCYNVLPYLLKQRMSGRPTRTIVQFLYQMACQESQQ